MGKKVLIGLAVLLLALIVVIAMQPREFRVTRSATIAAPPPAVFPHLNDLRKWDVWSPWAKKDPKMTQTYEGPASGTGAVYKWKGNHEVGEGRMTIIESRPNEVVRLRLEFQEPFAASNVVEFTLTPQGDQTALTWSMHGEKNFMSKAVGLFMNVDQMIGADFEQGLLALQAVARNEPAP